MNRRVLTRKALRAWLEALPPGAEAGTPNTPCDCPIARFMAHHLDPIICPPQVQRSRVCAGEEEFFLPNWADEFVDKVDGGEYDGAISASITREQALFVLASVGG